MSRYERSGAMLPRKRPSAAEQEPLPTESPRKQGSSSWSWCGPLLLCSPVSSALLTSLLFMPAQVLAPLQANNARSEGRNGRPNDDSADRAWPQVINVPSGAVLRGCKKPRRKLMAHFQLRAEVHSQLRFIASLFVLRIFLTCLVGYSTHGFRSAPTPPAVQPPQTPDVATLPPLPLRVPAHSPCPAFDNPNNQELLAKLQQLGSANLTGDHNTVSHHSMQLALAMQQHYCNPGKALCQALCQGSQGPVELERGGGATVHQDGVWRRLTSTAAYWAWRRGTPCRTSCHCPAACAMRCMCAGG
ncbi:hypothetical protein HaLaN_13813 [Haematococcus lacustris]|uniref:Uncharacterized protein n=1 Tax=Haematococcus lacustris TaxID=44745 RepID=A0A699Z3N8_HAELA|nr:hypothetical protein HaLaN_13813 [Haematococcus lacustris]